MEAFSLDIDRYVDAVKNLGSHTPKSARAPEELRMVRELLGGNGTVFTRDGRIGARFPSAGLLNLAEMSYKSNIYNVGSGGVIRDSNNRNYRDIFFDRNSKVSPPSLAHCTDPQTVVD